MTHTTRAIILQSIKYGETSLVVSAYTELFGLQTYMVNAVRSSRKGSSKAAMFQPASILELQVYHHEQKNMQRIREMSWAVLYNSVLTDVINNSIALFMVELLHHCLKQPESNADLFAFVEDALIHLDKAPANVAAYFPLFFALNLADFFGFKIHPDPKLNPPYFLDLQEGYFVKEMPRHPQCLAPDLALLTAELLMMRQPEEFAELHLNKQTRRTLLHAYEDYYALHVPGFRRLRTLQVLSEVL